MDKHVLSDGGLYQMDSTFLDLYDWPSGTTIWLNVYVAYRTISTTQLPLLFSCGSTRRGLGELATPIFVDVDQVQETIAQVSSFPI